MATIEIDKTEFTELVEREIEDGKLIEEGSFLGIHWHSIDGDVCEVENYPNRPDCLSVEGLARAYRGFFNIDPGREIYEVKDQGIELEVDQSVEDVRPYIGAAVIEDLDLSSKIINGLIQLQEKIHETMGRKRDKLAIGLHDLSTVKPPFTYTAVKPQKVSFSPLGFDEELNLNQILEKHEKGQEYRWILEEEEKYPVIQDVEGNILSFPPIINNELTEVGPETEKVFIDVTGKDQETVLKALNILSTALAERGGEINSVEVDGKDLPDLSPEDITLDLEYFRSVSGLKLDEKEVTDRLEMMKYSAETEENDIHVKVPAYRKDVMHQYDLIEDVIIAHRYSNIDSKLPEVDQIGRQKDIEDLSQVTRDILSGNGALEAMTYVHTNKEDLCDRLDRDLEVVQIENPLSDEYGALRDILIPSLLDVLQQNKHHKYPQKFFETGNVSVLDDSDTGASNRKKAAFIISGEGTDFTGAKEVLQALERDLGISLEVLSGSEPFFQENRAGEIIYGGKKIGFVGQFSQKVRDNWDLEKPAAGFELDLDAVLKKLNE